MLIGPDLLRTLRKTMTTKSSKELQDWCYEKQKSHVPPDKASNDDTIKEQ
jgi:hypothetical protein